MVAAQHDLTIEAGSTFKLNVAWQNPDGTPIDMTGYRVRAQFLHGGTETVVFDADTANPATGITVTTPDSSGSVLITVDADITADLAGTGRYQLEATSAEGDAERLLQGTFAVSPGAPA